MRVHFGQAHADNDKKPVACVWCGGWFVEAGENITSNPTCSKPCNGALLSSRQSGENSPNWKGGKSKHRGKEWEILTLFIRTRDGECLRCGRSKTESGRRRHVHHLIHRDEFEENENPDQPTNLVSLCFGCHQALEGESLDEQLEELSINSREELAFTDDQRREYEETRKRMMPKLRAPPKDSCQGRLAWSVTE